MTIRYQHLEPGHLRAAMQALESDSGGLTLSARVR
jgi:hypothetical protein